MTRYGSWLTNRRLFPAITPFTVLAETLVIFFLKNWLNEWHHSRVQNKNTAMNDVTAGYKIRIQQFTSYQGLCILTKFSSFAHPDRIVQRCDCREKVVNQSETHPNVVFFVLLLGLSVYRCFQAVYLVQKCDTPPSFSSFIFWCWCLYSKF